jgi:hypothetical protein
MTRRMSPDSSTDDFAQLLKEGWIAGYPPWFASFWIKPAKCKTQEQASRLLQLTRSIEDGKPEETRRLLVGIDPNLRLAVEGSRTESLLEWAAEKARHPECIHLLIAAGASLKAPNLVWKLVTYGDTELLAEVLHAGADPNAGPADERPLTAACWNNAKAVRLLLGAGARTDSTTTVYITNTKGVNKVTPLMVAAYAGAEQIVKLLLAAGADAQARDAAGNTAFDWVMISRAKAKAAKIVPLLEHAGAAVRSGGAGLPAPVDFAARGRSPEFRKAVNLAKAFTKSAPKPVELAEGPLAGARAFRLRSPEAAATLLEEFRPQAAAFGAFAFLCENLYEASVPYLVIVPTTDYREAIIAFETPEGQSVDSYELVGWLDELEKTQPFTVTHLAPDLIRAKFTSPLKDSVRIAKSIQKICPDVINSSITSVARHLAESNELYLWWD